MPLYDVTSPSGEVFEINAPDGATENEVLLYAQQQFGQMEEETVTIDTGSDVIETNVRDVQRYLCWWWRARCNNSKPTR